jgi:predicted Zn-dependent protease
MRPILSAVFTASLVALLGMPALATDQDQQIGQQMYQQLLQKGEIIPSSPLYDTLAPIAQRIKNVVDPQYDHPFRFVLVHEQQPNAFAVPGGNVYVTDSLMHFVDNEEELAGVLCHETSHTIHHDVTHLMTKDRNTELLGTLAQVFMMRTSYLGAAAMGPLSNLQEQHFSRAVETGADLKGSETCAQAGYNPYGMVWLFQKYAKSGAKSNSMEIMADHPTDGHRVNDLESHFRADPATFSKFTDDISKATPIKLPAASAYGQRPGYPGAQGAYGQQGPNGQYPQAGPYPQQPQPPYPQQPQPPYPQQPQPPYPQQPQPPYPQQPQPPQPPYPQQPQPPYPQQPQPPYPQQPQPPYPQQPSPSPAP